MNRKKQLEKFEYSAFRDTFIDRVADSPSCALAYHGPGLLQDNWKPKGGKVATEKRFTTKNDHVHDKYYSAEKRTMAYSAYRSLRGSTLSNTSPQRQEVLLSVKALFILTMSY